jgi:hypothetical protein
MSLDLEALRERLPESLRSRLPAGGSLLAWLSSLGPELADALIELGPSEMELVLDELVPAGLDAIPVLRRLEERTPDKQVRKSVRRSLHRLKSRGVDVGFAVRKERRNVLRPVEEVAEQGALTPVDARGHRAAFLLTPVRGGTRIYKVLLSDIEGILHLERGEGRRRDGRSFVRRLREEAQARIVLVEGGAVRSLVRRAQQGRSGPLPAEVDPKGVAELVDGETAPTPGEQARAKLAHTARALTESQTESILRQRVERGDLPAWFLEGEAVQETAQQLAEQERSQLVLSAVQKRERSHELLSRAAERILDEATRERLACRLEEMAVFLLDSADEEGAAAGVRMAEIIRAARAPLEVAYLRMLVELSCNVARQQQQEEDKGKLIVPA